MDPDAGWCQDPFFSLFAEEKTAFRSVEKNLRVFPVHCGWLMWLLTKNGMTKPEFELLTFWQKLGL